MNLSKYKKFFVPQHDTSDCGAACLLTIIRYYGGDVSLYRLRELCGTSNAGATLLGLLQGANSVGFDSEGAEAEGVQDLIEHGRPCVLAVVANEMFYHYVVCFQYEKGYFLISDPAKGLVELSSLELEKIWTKKCLLLKPNSNFVRSEDLEGAKKKRLLFLIKEDIGLIVPSIMLGLIIAILSLVMAVFSQKLVDDILPSQDKSKFLLGIILVLFLLLTNVIVAALRGRLLITQERRFNNRIFSFFFEKLLHLPKSFFDMRKVGDIVTRLNDTRRIQRVISTLVSDVVINLLIIITSFIALLFYSWEVTIVSFISMPVFYWIVSSKKKKITCQQSDVMNSFAICESGFINTINGISEIKCYSQENNFFWNNKRLYILAQDKVFNLGETKINIGVWAGICSTFIQIGIIAICSVLVFLGSLSIGELLAIIGITGTMFPAVANLSIVLIPINEARVAFERMNEVIDTNSEPNVKYKKNRDIEANLLELNNVSFRFVGRNRLLENISIQFRKGIITCIVGESGCGKSTLCQLLERFYMQEKGDIFLNGENASKISLSEWRNTISFIPQDVFVFNGTVLENICFGSVPENICDVEKFCERYGFDKFFVELPNGLGTLIGEDGINLSGGQKQLIAFARALYRSSSILVLDEITASMDRKMEKHICSLLKHLCSEYIIIFITHRLETARGLADNIVVIESGHISAQGSHDELMLSDNFYSKYWNSLM
mgnify:CR=1 FL=1